MSREQSITLQNHRSPSATASSTNMAASRDDGLELSSFGEEVSSHHDGGQQELARKKARVLVASSLLQLPIWGMLPSFVPCNPLASL